MGKRYMVVIYDVWRINFWRYIKNALPDNNKGSRIRNEAVAPSPNESSYYFMVYVICLEN